MTKTYKINGKEISPIQKLPFKEASLMQEDIIIQQFNFLLEALSDKEEVCNKCNWSNLHLKDGLCSNCRPKQEECPRKIPWECSDINCKQHSQPKQEEYYDHSNTKMWLVKENGNVEKFEEPKQEECKNDCVHRYPSSKDWCDKHKQSTSLKEEIKFVIDGKDFTRFGCILEIDEILSLIQSRACENCKHKFNHENNN